MRKSAKIIAMIGLLPGLLLAQSLPLGEVVAGGSVMVGTTMMPRGGTIFSGDSLHAGKESSVLQFNQDGKIELYPGAATDVARVGAQLTITLQDGKIAYSLPKGSGVLFDTPRVSIRPGNGADLFVGTIERQAESAVVQPLQGDMVVLNKETGETSTVRKGQTAICLVGTPFKWAGDPYAVTRIPWLYIAVGGGVATATGIIIHEVVSEEEPASPSGR